MKAAVVLDRLLEPTGRRGVGGGEVGWDAPHPHRLPDPGSANPRRLGDLRLSQPCS